MVCVFLCCFCCDRRWSWRESVLLCCSLVVFCSLICSQFPFCLDLRQYLSFRCCVSFVFCFLPSRFLSYAVNLFLFLFLISLSFVGLPTPDFAVVWFCCGLVRTCRLCLPTAHSTRIGDCRSGPAQSNVSQFDTVFSFCLGRGWWRARDCDGGA